MSGRFARLFLIIVAAVMAFAAAMFMLHPPQFRWTSPSTNALTLATRIARHPTDWEAASALTEVALDSRLENKIAVWRTAYEHARLLAPERTDPANAFARAAFFHWTELSPKDQHDALNVFAPLLRDEGLFSRMAKPLFELTGDLSLLRQAHPPTKYAIGIVMEIAAANGFFDDYRNLRAQMERRLSDDFAARRRTDTPAELIAHFPDPPYHAEAEPMITGLLGELHRRPLDDGPNRVAIIDGIVDYALRHGLGPLDGLEVITRKPDAASVATRIRLARNLGLTNIAEQMELATRDPRRVPTVDSDWQGLCDKDICYRAWRTIDAAHGVSLNIETVQTDNVPAYVEIYLDDIRLAEGEVGAKRDFIVPVGKAGVHRVEVLLANPTTRNRTPRRIRVASITTL